MQDTVVSLHALSRFSGLLQQSGLDVEVKLKTNLTEKTVHVNSKNKLLVQRVEVRNFLKKKNVKIIIIFFIFLNIVNFRIGIIYLEFPILKCD